VGQRRIGLAVSDATGTLARPLTTIEVEPSTAVDRVMREVDRLAAEEDGLDAIVVGMPAHLDGTPSEATRSVAAFVKALRGRTTIPVMSEDERLTSREAEARLAVRQRDWRRRKARLDAAAAAVFLQDFLDRRRSPGEGP
jgi:putative Holliday junction resolvase